MNAWYSSNTFGYMTYDVTSESVMCLPNLARSSALIFLKSELGAQLGLDLLEVQGCELGTGAAVDAGLVADDLGAQGLGKAANRLPEVALEELDDGRGEVELLGARDDVVLGEFVLRHPLREVADDLRRRRDLARRQPQTLRS